MHYRIKALWSRSMLAGVALLVWATAGLFTAQPTFAQSPTPQVKREELRAKEFKREQDALAKQQGRLKQAGTLASKTQDYLDKLKSQGKDTTAPAAALATFSSQVATAQSAHTTAANLLGAHAGFDANGQVTNLAQASQTVIGARQAIGDANRILRQATTDLARAVRNYRRSNSKA